MAGLPKFMQDGGRAARKKQSNIKKPRDHERRVSSVLGGKRQPGSGAFDEAKGDVSSDDYLVECKRTVNKSLSIKAEWLIKISREARVDGKYPALSFEFDPAIIKSIELKARTSKGDRTPMGLRNTTTTEETWVAVPLSVFKALVSDGDE